MLEARRIVDGITPAGELGCFNGCHLETTSRPSSVRVWTSQGGTRGLSGIYKAQHPSSRLLLCCDDHLELAISRYGGRPRERNVLYRAPGKERWMGWLALWKSVAGEGGTSAIQARISRVASTIGSVPRGSFIFLARTSHSWPTQQQPTRVDELRGPQQRLETLVPGPGSESGLADAWRPRMTSSRSRCPAPACSSRGRAIREGEKGRDPRVTGRGEGREAAVVCKRIQWTWA